MEFTLDNFFDFNFVLVDVLTGQYCYVFENYYVIGDIDRQDIIIQIQLNQKLQAGFLEIL
jgi:hypothetical protein